MMMMMMIISFFFSAMWAAGDFELWGFLDVSTTQPNRELLSFM
jgi:hypothetical protein